MSSKDGADDNGKLLYCSFCGKSQHEVRKLIAGPSVFICDECVDLCNDIIREEVQEAALLFLDDAPEGQVAGHRDHGQDRQDHRELVADHLRRGADAAEQRVLRVRGPAAQDDPVDPQAADGEDVSTSGLLRAVARALGRPARLIPVPAFVLTALAALAGKRDVARRLCDSLQVDITDTTTTLGWVPPVNMDTALRRTAQHFLNKETH